MGNLTAIEFILQHCNNNTNVNSEDTSPDYAWHYDYTPLIYASEYGHSEVVELLLQHPQIDVNKRNDYGWTALHRASVTGNSEVVDWTANRGHLEVVELLLHHPQIDVNIENNDGFTALYLASRDEHTEVVELLLQHQQIDVNKDVDKGWTALNYASRYGHSEVVELLLQHPQIDVNKGRNTGESGEVNAALILATNYGHSEIVGMLLQHPQIEVNIDDKYGRTALIRAADSGLPEIVDLLLEHPQIDVNKGRNNEQKQTALHDASENGHSEVVGLLLKHPQIDVNKENDVGQTALWIASKRVHINVIDILLINPEIDVLKGFIMNDDDIGKLIFGHDNLTVNEEFLFNTVMGNLIGVYKQLEDNETIIDYSDERGMTALIWASKNGYLEIVRLLLNTSQADINMERKSDGATALMLASYNRHTEVVEILLNQKNIDIGKKTTSKGDSALLMASYKGHEDVVKLLTMTNKVDINDVNSDGESPLYKASQNGHLEVVLWLLDNKDIDVNKATVDRVTPLMAAARGGHYYIVKILLSNPNIEANFANYDGKTALFFSIPSYYNVDHKKMQDLVELLLRCASLDINHIDENGNQALYYAAMTGFSNLTFSFEPKNHANLKKNGHTCCSGNVNDGLQIAAEEGDLTMVKAFLLCLQVDLNDGYKYGITPLYMATENNETEVARVLLDDPRTDVNKVVNSENVLIKASENGNVIILGLLLKHPGIDVNQINYQNKKTALIVAAESGFPDVVELLLMHPQTFVNSFDSHSESALKKAVDCDHYEVYELLLRCPKTTIPQEIEGYATDNLLIFGNQSAILAKDPTCCLNVSSVLLAASLKNDFRAIRGLLQCPNAEINKENTRGKTPIYLASWQGHLESVKVLVNNSELGVNKGNIKDGSTAFSIASERGNFEIMQILIGHEDIDLSAGWCKDNWAHHSSLCRISEDQKPTDSEKPAQSNENICSKFINMTGKEEFLSAAQSGDILRMDALLGGNESKSDLFICESTNAFILASANGHDEIIKMLLEFAPLNLNGFDESAKTALILASQKNHVNVVEVLLEQEELDANLAELIQGETPLYVASKMGHSNITSLLLAKSGIDVNKHTIHRGSPLIAASVGGYAEIVRLLLSHPDVNANFVDFDGKNALMHAIINKTGDNDLLDLLILCPSIDLHHRDESGNNVTDFAQNSNITDIFFDQVDVQRKRLDGHTCCSLKVNDGLQIASERGDFFMVQSFLQCRYLVDLNVGYEYDQTPLYMASMQNHIDVVKILLADSRTNVNKVVNSEHALLAATEKENTNIVELLLLHQQIDVNQINLINRKTALINAAESGYLDIVELLLKHPQTFVNNEDSFSEAALQKAIHEGHIEVVKLILRCTKTIIPKHIASNQTEILDAIEMRDELLNLGRTCCFNVISSLLSSAKNGDNRALRGLLQCPDANINTIDDRGRTPIYLASWKGHVAAVEVLLGDLNLDVNKGRIKDGGTAYSIASEKNHFSIMKILVGHQDFNANIGWSTHDWANYIIHDKEININGPFNVTMNETLDSNLIEEFISAARMGNLTKVQSLLDLELIDINRASVDGRTALYEACKNGHLVVVQVLLNYYHLDLNKQEPDFGETPLYAAATMGFSQIVSELINQDDIDVNRSTKNRTTPLIVASVNGRSDIIEMLLAHPDIDPNYATFKGQSSLFNSIIDLSKTLGLHIVRLHLKCPSVVTNKIDEDEKTPQMYAREKNLTEILEAFANRSNIMDDGHTCCSDRVNDGLKIAAEQGNLKMVKSFLKCSQVDLNIGYKYGITPLYQASNNGHSSSVEELLNDPRTDVNVEVNSGTALYTAAEHGNTQVVRLLLSHYDIDVNKLNARNQMSVLMIAVAKGHVGIVNLLIHHSQTDVNIIDAKDESAISIASKRGSLKLVKLILRCPKTNIDHLLQKGDEYHGPNMKEVFAYQTELTKLPSTCCLKIQESMLKAAWIGDFRGIRGLLLCPDANINALDERGRTPLYLASWLSHTKVVEVLLNDTDIDVNKGNISDGSTPFSIASEEGHFEIMEKLINHNRIIAGKGWSIDSWTPHFTRSEVTTEQTALPTTIETTTRRR